MKKVTMDNLKPGWREIILDMMSEGASRAEVIVAISARSYAIFSRLQEEDAEFGRMVAFGEVLSKAWWLKIGRENLKSRYFQTGLWSQNMKNRFGWTDKNVSVMEIGDSLYDKFKETKTKTLKDEAAKLLEHYGLGGLNTSEADNEGAGISEAPKSD